MNTNKALLVFLATVSAVLATAEVQLHGAADTAITAQDYPSKSGWAPDRQLLGQQDVAGNEELSEYGQAEPDAPFPSRKLLSGPGPRTSSPRKMLTGPKPTHPKKPANGARNNPNLNRQTTAVRSQAAASNSKNGKGPQAAAAAAAKKAVQNPTKQNQNNLAQSGNNVKSSTKPAPTTKPNRKSAAAASSTVAAAAAVKPVTVSVASSKPVVVSTPSKTAAVATAALPAAVPTTPAQQPAATTAPADTAAAAAATPLPAAAAAAAAVPSVAPVPTAAVTGSATGSKPLLERRGYSRRSGYGYGYGGYSGRSWGGQTFSMAGNPWRSYKSTCAHAGSAHACSFTR